MAMHLVITGEGVVPHVHNLGGGGFRSWCRCCGKEKIAASARNCSPFPCHMSHSTVLLSGAIRATKTTGIFQSCCNE